MGGVDLLLTGLHQLDQILEEHVSVPLTETFHIIRHLQTKNTSKLKNHRNLPNHRTQTNTHPTHPTSKQISVTKQSMSYINQVT